MPGTSDIAAESAASAHQDRAADSTKGSSHVPALLARVPRLGVWAWSFVGFVVASIIVVVALAAVNEIVLPMMFAAVLAIIFKPLVRVLERHKVWPALAAGIIVLGLLAVVTGVIIATVRGVTQQADQISGVADKAVSKAADLTDALGVDQSSLHAMRKAIEDAAPMITTGVLSGLISGFGTVIAVVSGVILGALIMYYLLKDGTRLRRAVVGQVDPEFRNDLDEFIGDSCRVLRDYGRGRTVMSAIVAVAIGLVALLLGLPLVFTIVVVNFIGGYIPYIGAFLGGGLAVIIALGDGGVPEAVVMLVVVLAANLVLENFVEPKVMGRTLDIHPLVVLIVTALGGLLGGIVGLILAVPVTVIAADAIGRMRSRGILQQAAQRARPAVQHMLD